MEILKRKEYLKELMANDDDFWTLFNAEDYYSRMEGAFKDEDDEYPFKFGVGKAKLILENIDAIKEFVEENDNEY